MVKIGNMAQSSGSNRRGPSLALPRSNNNNDEILASISNLVRQLFIFHKSKKAALNTAKFSKKLLQSTGKASWITGTTFLVLVVPLIIEMDQEQQMVEFKI
eukprot:Gb_19761 [translate_table: standard]